MSKRPTDSIILAEAKRLLALANNPGDATEMARALKRHAKTDHHVRTIVQYLLDNETFYPVPSAVRDAADLCASEPPPKYRPPDPDCRKCGGSGRVYAKRTVTTGPYPGVYEGVGDCECRLVEPREAVRA